MNNESEIRFGGCRAILGMVLIVVAGILSGCVTGESLVDYSRRIEGWPDMQTTITKVTATEASALCRSDEGGRCSTTAELLNITSCYIWDFAANKDYILYSLDEDLEHEGAHHRGHPHIGETADTGMQCSLDAWRDTQKRDRAHE